jgi:phytoene dehydrogenase-like protein
VERHQPLSDAGRTLESGGPLAAAALSRRRFVAAVAVGVAGVAAPALVGLPRRTGPRIAGGFVNEGSSLGHALRDGAPMPRAVRTERVRVVIVGGGIAGLSAGWRLAKRGMGEFVVLEAEPAVGGNARWGENEVSAYPWAAHYVPVPGARATLARELFADLGLLRDGEWDERSLCFSPRERTFIHGRWVEGLEGAVAHSAREREELRRLAARVAEMRASGEFTIPVAAGAPGDSPLDALSMAAWLTREGFTSRAAHWLADYGCRDDYGARSRDTSAWAGLHYWAAREGEERGPLTWPEGNGRIVRRLAARLGDRVRTGVGVHRVERAGRGIRVLAGDTEFRADAVVFAAPTFLAPYVVEGARAPGFTYSPWLTANLTLERWPAERPEAAPVAWDNVIHDSPGLGYVVATHQSLRTHQPRTVWTYYRPLADGDPRANRRALARATWAEWRDRILADLGRAHPDIGDCVSRIDVMRMGHAMARPAPGFLSRHAAHARRAELGGRLFYANSDVSGISIFEEAQYRGVRAAERALEVVESG